MIPPPTTTTSALSMTFHSVRARRATPAPRHAPHLEDQLQRGERRDVAAVERRRNLDDVETDQRRAVGGARQEIEGLSRRKPAGRRDLRPRRKRRIEGVDVERDVDLLAGQPLADLVSRMLRFASELLARAPPHPTPRGELQLLGV